MSQLILGSFGSDLCLVRVSLQEAAVWNLRKWEENPYDLLLAGAKIDDTPLNPRRLNILIY